jgi:hypothetical protein
MTGLLKDWLRSVSEERKNVAGSAAATTDRGAGLEESSALRQFGRMEKEDQILKLHRMICGVDAGYRLEARQVDRCEV